MLFHNQTTLPTPNGVGSVIFEKGIEYLKDLSYIDCIKEK